MRDNINNGKKAFGNASKILICINAITAQRTAGRRSMAYSYTLSKDVITIMLSLVIIESSRAITAFFV